MIRGPDGLYRTMVRINGQLCVQIVDVLGPDEVEVSLDEPTPARTVTPTIDDVALEDLLLRCRGGGVSEHAVTGAPITGGGGTTTIVGQTVQPPCTMTTF